MKSPYHCEFINRENGFLWPHQICAENRLATLSQGQPRWVSRLQVWKLDMDLTLKAVTLALPAGSSRAEPSHREESAK